MAEHELKQIISQLEKPHNLHQAPKLLSKAKLGLLHLHALVPSANTSPQHILLATSVLEHGALLSIRLKDTEAFTRYYQQLQPFYSLPHERWHRAGKPKNQSKVTGLYLLLLLSVGDYAGFHTVLEGLEMSSGKEYIEKDELIQYPVRLEQALMEGSYDKVWGETKGERVPSEEFAVFSEVSPPLQHPPQGVVTAREDAYTNVLGTRSSSTPSALKSPPAPSAPTLPFKSATPRTCCSSTRKARSSSSRKRAAGWRRMAAYTSRSRRRRCWPRGRTS